MYAVNYEDAWPFSCGFSDGKLKGYREGQVKKVETPSDEEIRYLREFNQTLLQREGQKNGRLLTRIRELETEHKPRYGSKRFPYIYHEDHIDGRTLVPEYVARNLIGGDRR